MNPIEFGAVLFDIDLDFNLAKFYCAEYILNKNIECLLMLGATDPEYFILDYTFVGLGMFHNLLQSRCKQDAVILGKPGHELAELVMNKYGIRDSSRVLFVGDSLSQDIGFGRKNGFQTLLVLSGMTTEDMLGKIANPDEVPHYVTKGLGDIAKVYEELQGSQL